MVCIDIFKTIFYIVEYQFSQKAFEDSQQTEKSRMVLQIKFDEALNENDDLKAQNSDLNNKVASLSNNISKAEIRSESVS